MSRRGWGVWLGLSGMVAGLVGIETVLAAPTLSYAAAELETGGGYRPGEPPVDAAYARFIGTLEVALTGTLGARAVVAPCLGAYIDTPDSVGDCSPHRLIEHMSVDGFGAEYDFSIGRQVVSLGNTEGFVLLDRLNGRDYCRFARLDTDNKLPNGLARGRVFAGPATFTLLYAPFSPESRTPASDGYCADRYNDPGGLDHLSPPDHEGLSDWAGALGFGLDLDRWNFTLNLLSTREDVFVLRTAPTFEKTRPRTHWLGGSASTTLGDFVLRGEWAYAPERAFTLTSAETLARVMRGETTDGTEERWNLLGSLGLELRDGDWFWALQYFRDQVENGADLSRRRLQEMVSLRTRVGFANDRVELSVFAIADLTAQDLAFNVVVDYEINDSVRLEAGGTLYSDYAGAAGYFGEYAGRESFFLRLNWTL